MVKRIGIMILIAGALFLFTGCAGEKMDLEVKATMDGQAAAQAAVTVDGEPQGMTGPDGSFVKTLKKKPGAEIEVIVSKEQPGYKITPWKTTFLMKLPKKGTVDRYTFEADLAATRFVTIVASEAGAPVPDASVRAAGAEVGRTDARGEYVYEYTELPKGVSDLSVTKSGYATWKHRGPIEPGQRLEAALTKRVQVTVTALRDEYGQASGIPGLSVSIDKRRIGRTDAKGVVVWSYDGEPGRKVQVRVDAPGHVPEAWKTTVVLEGEIDLKRYFMPITARPIRTGIYGFVGNTPTVDLRDVVTQTEQAVAGQLFRYSCFKEVATPALQAGMKSARISIDRAQSKGWRETALRRTVDMIVLGSVAKDDQGYLIEAKFVGSSGKIIHSQLARARRERDIEGAAKDMARAVLAKFPFEGTVVGRDDDLLRINLGKEGYKIAKNTEFTLLSPRTDDSGKVSGYRDIGRLKVRKTSDAYSLAEAYDLKRGEKAAVGDRVVRISGREDDGERTVALLSTRGGVPPDVTPLAGVNIYLNDAWVGTTGPDGTAEVPVRVGRKYDIVLYRHGYQQVSDALRIEKDREQKQYTLVVNNSIFRIESVPSGADVFVDDAKIGSTPISDGKPVTLGFHTVRVAVGGDYRDWEEVMEFASKTEERTGSRAIVLQKDYLRIGERAAQKGDVEGAIAAYRSTEKGHPDYSEAHHRLARLYLDEKSDYDNAIAEFENVLSLPENEQLVYKQFSVAYMNLGHAYYERGNALVQKDRDGAAQGFAKAIENLKIAKQNTRFFPTDRYDEAVHDTYYYAALSYHKLYLLTRKPALLNSANQAWQEYFDFFPKKLEGSAAFEQSREAARTYWDQIKKQM